MGYFFFPFFLLIVLPSCALLGALTAAGTEWFYLESLQGQRTSEAGGVGGVGRVCVGPEPRVLVLILPLSVV